MNPNEPIHNRRLLLWATGGLALIFLVYFIDPVTYTHQAAITEGKAVPLSTIKPVNETVSQARSD